MAQDLPWCGELKLSAKKFYKKNYMKIHLL